MSKNMIAGFILVALSFFVGAVLFPMMPDMMVSHWNIVGEADEYLPKFWGLFLMPILSFVMFFCFLFLPKMDPLRENFEKFRRVFERFFLVLLLFLFYLYAITLLWNIGFRFRMNVVLPPAFSLLLFFTGVLLGKAERNWFVGIRTPWTLSSETVWKKTHVLGATLFKFSGVIALASLFVPEYAFLLVLAPVLLSTVSLVLYSYFEYRKERNMYGKMDGKTG